jgi:hypothetical protein
MAHAKIEVLTFTIGLEPYCTSFADLFIYSPFLIYLQSIRKTLRNLKDGGTREIRTNGKK